MKPILWLILLFPLLLTQAVWAKALRVGHPAPEFSAQTDQGQSLSLQDFRGKFVVLYFYPKDDTPGCTIEAKGFGELYPKFKSLNAEILGVSYDSVASHQAFIKTYQIPYRLLADTERQLAQAYGVAQPFFAERNTFIISPQGILLAVYQDVNPSGHALEVLQWLEQYTKSQQPVGPDAQPPEKKKPLGN